MVAAARAVEPPLRKQATCYFSGRLLTKDSFVASSFFVLLDVLLKD
jgi:hypothetical protein